MWTSVPAQTRLYRVSRPLDIWPAPVHGLGSFFNQGGRYNSPHQLTVYTSDDPLAALTEYAFHQIVDWCGTAARGQPLPSPLQATARLWCFTCAHRLPLINVSHQTARGQFHFPAHAPFNPHDRDYSCTQQLANQIRNFVPPQPRTRAEGLFAPSIRTPRVGAYQPSQAVLFVFPLGVGPGPLDQSCQHMADWEVELEVRSVGVRGRVGPSTLRIDWLTPRFRLHGNPAPVQPAAGRPRGAVIAPNTWHNLPVKFAAS
jgi:hypothetical protein